MVFTGNKSQTLLLLTLTFLLIFISANLLYGETVTREMAKSVGQTQLKAQRAQWNVKPNLAPQAFVEGRKYSIKRTREFRIKGELLSYIHDLSPSGFIAISPDTDIEPMIAYSFKGHFSMEKDPSNVLLVLLASDMNERLENLSAFPIQVYDSGVIFGSLSGDGVIQAVSLLVVDLQSI